MLITIKHLDEWGACGREDGERYCDSRLLKWLGGRGGLTPLEVLRLRQVPYENRLWPMYWCLSDDILSEFANACADRAVRKYALGTVINEWARRWLSGEDRTVEAASAAARTAWAAWAAQTARTAWAAQTARTARAARAAAQAASWAARAARAAGAAERAVRAAERAVRAMRATWAARAASWAAEASWAAAEAGAIERRWQVRWLQKRLAD